MVRPPVPQVQILARVEPSGNLRFERLNSGTRFGLLQEETALKGALPELLPLACEYPDDAFDLKSTAVAWAFDKLGARN
jgi:hypothetical protein